jgi:hypothetical protein
MMNSRRKHRFRGATVVLELYAGPSREYNLPICILAERGDSSNDDTFYENNVVGSVLEPLAACRIS